MSTGCNMNTILQHAIMINRRTRVDNNSLPDAGTNIDDSTRNDYRTRTDNGSTADGCTRVNESREPRAYTPKSQQQFKPHSIVTDGNNYRVECARLSHQVLTCARYTPRRLQSYVVSIIKEDNPLPSQRVGAVSNDASMSARAKNRQSTAHLMSICREARSIWF